MEFRVYTTVEDTRDQWLALVSQIHPSFQHLRRVQYYRRKILQKQKVSTDFSEKFTLHNGLSQGFH
jgi:hypothetical protein